MRLEGKVALVTDVHSAGGAAIATRFAREGARVAACPAGGPKQTGPAATPGSLTPEVLLLEGDVCAPGEAQRIIDTVADRYGRLDVLVNHGAGGRIVGTILDLTENDFHEGVTGDLWSVIALSAAVIPLMARGGGGSIVNISSIARLGVKERPLRSASQAAVSALTRSMALDHGADGIRVNALLLGPTQTAEPPADPEERQQFLARFRGHAPLGTLHTAEDVAAAALFLVSDEARCITGALIPLDAGRSLPNF